jgi:hypothetical protein
MFTCIALNKEISCENICSQVQNLVQKYAQTNSDFSNVILNIEIKSVVDSSYDSIPKLESNM